MRSGRKAADVTAAISAAILSAVGAAFVASTAAAQTSIIQSNVGIGCSSVCINGNCTSTCGDQSSNAMKGNGDVQTSEFDFEDFSAVVTSNINTTITRGDDWGVSVRADSNLTDRVEVRLDGDTLYVSLKDGLYQEATIEVNLVMPALNQLRQLGAAKVVFSGFDQSSLELNASGAGKITGSDNTFDDLRLSSSGAGFLDMTRSELTHASVAIDGAADVRLNFSQASSSGKARIEGRITGASALHLCGKPENSLSVFGVADIVHSHCS